MLNVFVDARSNLLIYHEKKKLPSTGEASEELISL
jgi:hypothetical protein